MSVLMAEVSIIIADVHNMTHMVDARLLLNGRMSSLLDIVICIMVCTLIYVAACAFNECKEACSPKTPRDSESDNVQLIQREVTQSSH